MIIFESDCCDCAVPGYPCVGKSCPRYSSPHYYCDICKEEKVLYKYDGEQLCIECIENKLEIVEGSEL